MSIRTKPATQAYRDWWDRAFHEKNETPFNHTGLGRKADYVCTRCGLIGMKGEVISHKCPRKKFYAK